MEPPCKIRRQESPNKEQTPISQTSESDTNHLLTIFPKEIWILVLNNVGTLDDYYKIGDASPLFLDGMSHKRIHILFSPVLEILLQISTLWERKQPAAVLENNDNNRYDIQPLASLRQVCRSWRKAIDAFNQNMPFQYKFQREYMSIDGGTYEGLAEYFTQSFYFGSANLFTKFRTHYEASHAANSTANPFPVRKMGIFPPISAGQEANLFYAQLCSFLQDYGQHIWYFFIDARNTNETLAILQLYRNLKHILKRVPNIKTFRIFVPCSVLPLYVENQVIENYQKMSFPALNHLQFIDQNGVPLSIFSEVLRKIKLSKLEQIGMMLASEIDVELFLENTLRYPLKKLRLEIHVPLAKWSTVFDTVSKQYGETLEHLEISLTRPDIFILDGRISLPQLKVLFLEVDGPVALDFLLGLSSTLEKLDLRFRRMRQVQLEHVLSEERVVKFYRHLKELHKSSIWTNFPKLQSVDVWRSLLQERTPSWSGTRKIWERENKKRRGPK